MFAPRYFAPHYFAPHYFGVGEDTIDGFALATAARFGQIHIVELEGLQRSLTREAESFILPFGLYPFGVAPTSAAPDSGVINFRYSDTGYISPPTGTLSNTIFEGRVSQPLQLTRSLPVVPEQSRRVVLELGAIDIVNVDGLLDTAPQTYAVDGRPVRVLLGLDYFTYDDFVPMFTGRAVSWGADFSAVQVEVRDQGYRLDIPLQSTLYGGTGGADGTSDLAGKPLPVAFGKLLNIEPPLIDPSYLVYQFHFREAESVDAIYDRGAALTPTSDHADYAALTAASLSTGEYATCLALGLFRLGSSPSGLVTADVHGDAHGSYIDTTSAIGQRLITGFSDFTSSDLESALWTALGTDVPGTIGWWQGTDPILVSDALSAVMGACGAWWGANRDGLIGAGIVSEPDAGDIAAALDEADVLLIEKPQAPDGTFPPRFRQRVGYQKNWTVQRGEDLAGSVDASRRQFLTQDYRVVTSENADTRTEFLLATDPAMLGSLFDSESDAQAICDGLIALLSGVRQTVRVTLGYKGLNAPIGGTVQLTHRRVNSGNPWLARVIDQSIVAASRQVELVLWG